MAMTLFTIKVVGISPPRVVMILSIFLKAFLKALVKLWRRYSNQTKSILGDGDDKVFGGKGAQFANGGSGDDCFDLGDGDDGYGHLGSDEFVINLQIQEQT